jgi:hypothetical protein
LELGRHLVRELGLKDRGDTLGLWMAHHIAALIKAAEKEKSLVKRKRAEKEATQTILKIWEHRESLPLYSYPLARYDDLFRVLDRLQPSNNPFRYGNDDPGIRTDQLAATLFDSLSRLIMCLLLMKPLSLYAEETVNEAVLDALSEEERHVWDALQKWNEIFLPKSDSSEQAQAAETKTERADIDLKKIALDLAKRIKGPLQALQTELEKPDVESSGSRVVVKKMPAKRPGKRAKHK